MFYNLICVYVALLPLCKGDVEMQVSSALDCHSSFHAKWQLVNVCYPCNLAHVDLMTLCVKTGECPMEIFFIGFVIVFWT